MNGASLFSGVGGLDLGMHRAGVNIVFQCESDAYRRRVLARHWPGVPCFEDVREVNVASVRRVQPVNGRGRNAPNSKGGLAVELDLLFGGFPCQDLSVAGRRAGLEGGERSSLFFEFARIADTLLGPGGWVLIENVLGLLSSNGGRDFAVLLATLAELGFHDLAWRVLDSRYLGVPQRRRRVFILARRAGGRRAQQVLLEPESGGGDFEASRETRKGIAGSVSDGAQAARSVTRGVGGRLDGETEDFVSALDRKGGGADDNDAQAGHLVAHTLRAEGFDASEDGTGRGTPLIADGVRAPSGLPGRMDVGAEPDDLASIRASSGGSSRSYVYGAAKDTDRCAVDPRPDGPRYAACGDAVTVNTAYWIGRRLMAHLTQPSTQAIEKASSE